ncbi:endonuclease/exonuclease/phosphatase family protein [Frigidibacter sp. ROC022]|uniref:endonuclease/exonuclease/phosphatase family protein n=1 Tax=Frigidibacter sp. ROC022 TaxID=2971796 RepID=UPI00215A2B5F|nr:endonuclease/exonuclease/phosphatase family protein [Frigidibacter sp. ROC022]MCR8722975.1 endonuclease [Frigidibacter sp. ROC022]
MRIATYNVEWFNALFDDEDLLGWDRRWSGRRDIRREDQLAALGLVFGSLNADAVFVVEAPDTTQKRSTTRALEAFAAHFGLRASKAITGFPNDTQQELALLYDPRVIAAVHDPRGGGSGVLGEGEVPKFDRTLRIDLDGDGVARPVSFSKPPLELALELRGSGPDGGGTRMVRMIGVHIKSKAPNGARGKSEILRMAVENRKKQLAQCLWLRARVVEDMKAGDDVIVLGDFNDGPGLDEYEHLFGRSGVEVVLGEQGPLHLYDPHARLALAQKVGIIPATARFLIPDDAEGLGDSMTEDGPEGSGRRWLSALLDYIMISPALRECHPKWRIWHPFDDADCYHDLALRDALLTASDHFPVTLDFSP